MKCNVLIVCLTKQTQKVFEHRWAPLVASLILILAFLYGFYERGALRSVLCNGEEHCFREWVSASGGWAAVAVAIITLFFLRKQILSQQEQIEQADWYQRADFEVRLRREKVLAEAVIRFANDVGPLILNPDGRLTKLMDHPDNYRRIVEVLEGEMIERFETEIATPTNMRGRIVAGIAKRGLEGSEFDAKAAPLHIKSYFELISTQAYAFLRFLEDRTRPKKRH